MDDLANIFQNYQKTIPEKISLLKNLVAQLKTTHSPEDLKNLQMAVHKIAGNSGSYGFLKASDLCRNLDQDLREKLGSLSPSDLTTEWLQSLDLFLKNVEEAFQKPDRPFKID